MTPQMLQKKMRQKKINIPDKNILENVYFETLGMGMAIVRIDPKLASLWISLMPSEQRLLNKSNLQKLCDSLSMGFWNEKNGETIKFDTSGSMIDGQHRLYMIERTQKTITCPVWYGCEKDSITTIDTGKARSLGDILKIHGFTQSNQAASVVNNIMSYIECGHLKTTSCTSAALRWAQGHSTKLYRSMKAAQQAKPYLPVSIGGMLHYLYSEVDNQGADMMFREFKKSTGRCNAVDTLKNTTVKYKEKGRGVHLSNQLYCSLATKAFNAYFLGDDVKVLRWNRAERTPQVIDVWM